MAAEAHLHRGGDGENPNPSPVATLGESKGVTALNYNNMAESIDENKGEDADGQSHGEPDDFTADETLQRYFAVARQFSSDTFFEVAADELPSRGPYKAHMKMGHGAKWFSKFVEFIEAGGCAYYKNSVMANIRINNLADLDVMAGTARVNFYLVSHRNFLLLDFPSLVHNSIMSKKYTTCASRIAQ
jgi:hypothetical protein